MALNVFPSSNTPSQAIGGGEGADDKRDKHFSFGQSPVADKIPAFASNTTFISHLDDHICGENIIFRCANFHEDWQRRLVYFRCLHLPPPDPCDATDVVFCAGASNRFPEAAEVLRPRLIGMCANPLMLRAAIDRSMLHNDEAALRVLLECAPQGPTLRAAKGLAIITAAGVGSVRMLRFLLASAGEGCVRELVPEFALPSLDTPADASICLSVGCLALSFLLKNCASMDEGGALACASLLLGAGVPIHGCGCTYTWVQAVP